MEGALLSEWYIPPWDAFGPTPTMCSFGGSAVSEARQRATSAPHKRNTTLAVKPYWALWVLLA